MKNIYIILGIVVLAMAGVVWKSNSDRKAREEALALQTQQHNQKMSQLEAENQARLAQEAKDKTQQEQSRIEHSNKIEPEQNTVNSEPPSKKAAISSEELSSRCKSMSELARIIMQKRQDGVPMSEIVEKVVNTTPQPLQEVLRLTVISAYDKPRFNTPEIQQKTILDFENESYLTCTKAGS